ncbi:unnamed protein product, partial [Hapterophycus canaliculatus]
MEVNAIDDASANDLPTKACLAVGAPVVLHKTPQFVLLGVCNNSDGDIHGIELDPREEYLAQRRPGYALVHLRYPPLRVTIYIQSAYEAGLQLDGLPRGVIAVASIEKTLSVVGIAKRRFTIRRRQVPLTAGCLSSVYRSQGHTMRSIILDIRDPPRNRIDSAAIHVVLSRATCLEDLYLL